MGLLRMTPRCTEAQAHTGISSGLAALSQAVRKVGKELLRSAAKGPLGALQGQHGCSSATGTCHVFQHPVRGAISGGLQAGCAAVRQYLKRRCSARSALGRVRAGHIEAVASDSGRQPAVLERVAAGRVHINAGHLHRMHRTGMTKRRSPLSARGQRSCWSGQPLSIAWHAAPPAQTFLTWKRSAQMRCLLASGPLRWRQVWPVQGAPGHTTMVRTLSQYDINLPCADAHGVHLDNLAIPCVGSAHSPHRSAEGCSLQVCRARDLDRGAQGGRRHWSCILPSNRGTEGGGCHCWRSLPRACQRSRVARRTARWLLQGTRACSGSAPPELPRRLQV